MSGTKAKNGLAARLSRFLAGAFGGEGDDSPSPLQHEIDALLERMANLSDDDAMFLGDLWEREDGDARRAAWLDAQLEIAVAGEETSLKQVREAVSAWSQARSTDFQGVEGLMGNAGAPATARQAAARAVIDKAVAILGRQGLDEQQLLVLSRPWDTLVG